MKLLYAINAYIFIRSEIDIAPKCALSHIIKEKVRS